MRGWVISKELIVFLREVRIYFLFFIYVFKVDFKFFKVEGYGSNLEVKVREEGVW